MENSQIVELMIQRDTTIINKLFGPDHLSALDLALETGHQACVKILKDAGAMTSSFVILFATLRLQRFWRRLKKQPFKQKRRRGKGGGGGRSTRREKHRVSSVHAQNASSHRSKTQTRSHRP